MATVVSIAEVRLAAVPCDRLDALARFRTLAGLQVWNIDRRLWLRWQQQQPELATALLAIPEVWLFIPDGKHWRRLGSALPDFTVPTFDEGKPLDYFLHPAPLQPRFRSETQRVQPLRPQLVPSDAIQATTALRCSLAELADWAETATTHRLAHIEGMHRHTTVWLRGANLPRLPNAQAFWGQRVLCPLGQRLQPDWPEALWLNAARVEDNQWLIVTPEGFEVLACDRFAPLSRAGIRRAYQAQINAQGGRS